MSKQEILEKVEKVASDQNQMEGMEILENVLEGLIDWGEKKGETSKLLQSKRKELAETKSEQYFFKESPFLAPSILGGQFVITSLTSPGRVKYLSLIFIRN